MVWFRLHVIKNDDLVKRNGVFFISAVLRIKSLSLTKVVLGIDEITLIIT